MVWMLYQCTLMLSEKIFSAMRNFLSPSRTFLVTNVITLIQVLCDIRCETEVVFNDYALKLELKFQFQLELKV